MRPSSSQLFCARRALTFRSAREPRRLIFHILSITLTLEALAGAPDSGPSTLTDALPLPQPPPPPPPSALGGVNWPPSYLSTFPHKICGPHSQAGSAEAKREMCAPTSVMGSLTAWPLLKGVTVRISRRDGGSTREAFFFSFFFFSPAAKENTSRSRPPHPMPPNATPPPVRRGLPPLCGEKKPKKRANQCRRNTRY